MAEDRSRGLLTDTDRDMIQQDWSDKSRVDKQPLYNLRTRVRNRTDELIEDIRLLNEHEPELAEEIITHMEHIRWADPDTTYSGDKENDSKTAFINGSEELPPTRDVIEHGGSDKVTWGYRGTGPLQLATDLLIDATDVRVAEQHSKSFMLDVTSSLDNKWELTAAEIQEWVRDIEMPEDAPEV